MTQALVLFAHGARDPRWAEPFDAVAARIRAAAPELPVALAFLELMTPSLDAAVARLVAEGATRIDVVPLFLGTGGHLRQDLPPLVDALAAAHPGIAIRLHAAIGEHAAVSEAMARAALVAAGFGE
ncbi:MAG TPA: CbiX/SirB N-terminal domain-containing protein [Caldimonas sp.]|jgi:sirohydrochlorin cobaltochelatase|nr:CbiX/SirB N-terminal domain-containing protein [Caldimonas sp.]HEX4235299.1 CbiX/SirB N-terminal domain-containing protein [Caldimonas sp.]